MLWHKFAKCSASGPTAEPKSTASLSRIIGQFASFPSLLLPGIEMCTGTGGDGGIKWPRAKSNLN